MNSLSSQLLNDWTCHGHRTAMAKSLELLAMEYPELCVITADLTPTARLIDFKNNFPDRFMDVGIAEQNLIDFAAGLAVEGLHPVAVGLAAMVPMRCAEQMRVGLGYMNLPATVVSIEAGVRFGPLGNTHYAMDDIAVVRAIPNFTVVCPSDAYQIYASLRAAMTHTGPMYIRLTGGPGSPLMYPDELDFTIGKAIEYRKGTDVAFISTGSMLADSVDAAAFLDSNNISSRVIDMHTIKPLDTDMLDDVIANNSLIVTVEEHSSIGGLGSAVAEYKSRFASAPKQVMASLGDKFQILGDHAYLLDANGLTAEGLAHLVMDQLS